MFAGRKKFMKNRLEDYTYLVSKEQPLSYETENLQKIILNLEFTNVDNNYKVIQITSTAQSEGKTTLIANLAYLLKEKGKKVIVLDLDLRRPKIHRIHSVSNEKGLTDYLLGNIPFESIIRKSDDFDYIVSGPTTTAINNALISDKLTKVINDLKGMYDYVLVDSHLLVLYQMLIILHN